MRFAWIAIAILIMAWGCEQKDQDGRLKVQIGTGVFRLEVADQEVTRARGLMQRDSMPADAGMLFVMPQVREMQFWMKNTRIPLDIIYLDERGRVISIHAMRPYDLSSVNSHGPGLYAIELNQGTATRVGIKAGDFVALPPGLKAKDAAP